MSVIDLASKKELRAAPCQTPGCGVTRTMETCAGCGKHHCERHLYRARNALLQEHYNCKPCAKRATELIFVESVQKALTLLFSAGLAAVTIESPNGKSVRYDAPRVDAARALEAAAQPELSIEDAHRKAADALGYSDEPADDEACAVVTIESPNLAFLEGEFTVVALRQIIEDMEKRQEVAAGVEPRSILEDSHGGD